MSYAYLAVFVGYLVVVLAIGLWGLRRESYDGYTVAEDNVGLPLSVPALFEARHRSRSLRAFSALVIVVAFAFSVMTQLVAGSIVLDVVVGIPPVIGLVLLAVVLTAYTVMGGLISVVRTDFLQGALILVGVLAAFLVVASTMGGDLLRLEPDQTRIFAGSVGSPVDVVAFLLIAWGAVASSVGGFLGYFVSLSLVEYAGLGVPGDPIFYGFGISLVAFVVVSLTTKPLEDPAMHRRFFEPAGVESAGTR